MAGRLMKRLLVGLAVDIGLISLVGLLAYWAWIELCVPHSSSSGARAVFPPAYDRQDRYKTSETLESVSGGKNAFQDGFIKVGESRKQEVPSDNSGIPRGSGRLKDVSDAEKFTENEHDFPVHLGGAFRILFEKELKEMPESDLVPKSESRYGEYYTQERFSSVLGRASLEQPDEGDGELAGRKGEDDKKTKGRRTAYEPDANEITDTSRYILGSLQRYDKLLMTVADGMRFDTSLFLEDACDFYTYDESSPLHYRMSNKEHWRNCRKIRAGNQNSVTVFEEFSRIPKFKEKFRFMKLIADVPSWTLNSLHSLFVGGAPQLMNFRNPLQAQSVMVDNLMAQLRRRGDCSPARYGNRTFSKLFPNEFSRQETSVSFYFSELGIAADMLVYRYALGEAYDRNWSFLYLHLLGYDVAGHYYSDVQGEEQLVKIQESNQFLTELLQVITNTLDESDANNEPHSCEEMSIVVNDHVLSLHYYTGEKRVDKQICPRDKFGIEGVTFLPWWRSGTPQTYKMAYDYNKPKRDVHTRRVITPRADVMHRSMENRSSDAEGGSAETKRGVNDKGKKHSQQELSRILSLEEWKTLRNDDDHIIKRKFKSPRDVYDDTQVFFLSDHGMTDVGNHGGADQDARDAVFSVYSGLDLMDLKALLPNTVDFFPPPRGNSHIGIQPATDNHRGYTMFPIQFLLPVVAMLQGVPIPRNVNAPILPDIIPKIDNCSKLCHLAYLAAHYYYSVTHLHSVNVTVEAAEYREMHNSYVTFRNKLTSFLEADTLAQDSNKITERNYLIEAIQDYIKHAMVFGELFYQEIGYGRKNPPIHIHIGFYLNFCTALLCLFWLTSMRKLSDYYNAVCQILTRFLLTRDTGDVLANSPAKPATGAQSKDTLNFEEMDKKFLFSGGCLIPTYIIFLPLLVVVIDALYERIVGSPISGIFSFEFLLAGLSSFFLFYFSVWLFKASGFKPLQSNIFDIRVISKSLKNTPNIGCRHLYSAYLPESPVTLFSLLFEHGLFEALFIAIPQALAFGYSYHAWEHRTYRTLVVYYLFFHLLIATIRTLVGNHLRHQERLRASSYGKHGIEENHARFTVEKNIGFLWFLWVTYSCLMYIGDCVGTNSNQLPGTHLHDWLAKNVIGKCAISDALLMPLQSLLETDTLNSISIPCAFVVYIGCSVWILKNHSRLKQSASSMSLDSRSAKKSSNCSYLKMKNILLAIWPHVQIAICLFFTVLTYIDWNRLSDFNNGYGLQTCRVVLFCSLCCGVGMWLFPRWFNTTSVSASCLLCVCGGGSARDLGSEAKSRTILSCLPDRNIVREIPIVIEGQDVDNLASKGKEIVALQKQNYLIFLSTCMLRCAVIFSCGYLPFFMMLRRNSKTITIAIQLVELYAICYFLTAELAYPSLTVLSRASKTRDKNGAAANDRPQDQRAAKRTESYDEGVKKTEFLFTAPAVVLLLMGNSITCYFDSGLVFGAEGLDLKAGFVGLGFFVVGLSQFLVLVSTVLPLICVGCFIIYMICAREFVAHKNMIFAQTHQFQGAVPTLDDVKDRSAACRKTVYEDAQIMRFIAKIAFTFGCTICLHFVAIICSTMPFFLRMDRHVLTGAMSRRVVWLCALFASTCLGIYKTLLLFMRFVYRYHTSPCSSSKLKQT